MKTTIIYETIEVDKNGEYVIEADPKIIKEMREKLRPSKKFSYSDGDHLKQAIKDEERMRKGNK